MDFETNRIPNKDYAMSYNPILIDPPNFNNVTFLVAT